MVIRKPLKTLRQASREKAERYRKQKLWQEAIAEYEALIAAGADTTGTWLQLGKVWQARYNKEKTYQHRERALQASYNAYRAANTADEQARALFMLGDLYISKNQPRSAMAAFKEGLGLEENAEIASATSNWWKPTRFASKGWMWSRIAPSQKFVCGLPIPEQKIGRFTMKII
ncbi:MAG: hypothetical protein R3F37_18485 [Candidatus Competibacteraceae bacterium]